MFITGRIVMIGFSKEDHVSPLQTQKAVMYQGSSAPGFSLVCYCEVIGATEGGWVSKGHFLA